MKEAWSVSAFAHADLPWNQPAPAEIWQSSDTLAVEMAKQAVFLRRLYRRNFSGFPFLIAAQEGQVLQIMQLVSSWTKAQGGEGSVRLSDLPSQALGALRERTILPWQPVTFPQVKAQKALVLGARALASPFAFRLGEVEHLQVLIWQPGWRLAQPDSHGMEKALEDRTGTFCHTERFGFLTSDPHWAGAGEQWEALLHLPALTSQRAIGQAHEGCQALGLLFHPEPMGAISGLEAGYFRVSSRGGLGQKPEELRQAFLKALTPLVQWESQLRLAWWKKDRPILLDRIHRSQRMLAEAQMLPMHEALGFTAFVRLGVALEEVDAAWLEPIERIRILAQSSHLGPWVVGTGAADWQEKQRADDTNRAEKVRSLWVLPGGKPSLAT